MKYLCVVSVLVISACVSQPPIAERIIGTWEGQFMGQTLTLVIDDTVITPSGPIMGYSPYELEGDLISFNLNGSTQYRRVTFAGPDKMTLSNEESGVATEYARVASP